MFISSWISCYWNSWAPKSKYNNFSTCVLQQWVAQCWDVRLCYISCCWIYTHLSITLRSCIHVSAVSCWTVTGFQHACRQHYSQEVAVFEIYESAFPQVHRITQTTCVQEGESFSIQRQQHSRGENREEEHPEKRPIKSTTCPPSSNTVQTEN